MIAGNEKWYSKNKLIPQMPALDIFLQREARTVSIRFFAGNVSFPFMCEQMDNIKKCYDEALKHAFEK